MYEIRQNYTCYLTAIFEPDNNSCHLLFTLKLYVCLTLLFKVVDKRESVKPQSCKRPPEMSSVGGCL